MISLRRTWFLSFATDLTHLASRHNKRVRFRSISHFRSGTQCGITPFRYSCIAAESSLTSHTNRCCSTDRTSRTGKQRNGDWVSGGSRTGPASISNMPSQRFAIRWKADTDTAARDGLCGKGETVRPRLQPVAAEKLFSKNTLNPLAASDRSVHTEHITASNPDRNEAR